MPSVDLFVEDHAHELFVSALIRRIFSEANLPFALNVRSAVGGHGRALTELRSYQRAVIKGAVGLSRPDLLVVMIDANCQGPAEARRSILNEIMIDAAGDTVVACPDPHIERWFFADPQAFTTVVGLDHRPGRRKCDKGAYKIMLKEAVARAGHFPSLGGLEFAADLVLSMDLHRAARNEPSLAVLCDGLRAFTRRSGQ